MSEYGIQFLDGNLGIAYELQESILLEFLWVGDLEFWAYSVSNGNLAGLGYVSTLET